MTDDAKRLDTKLEAEAAEFLVLGRLLLERIVAFKAYVNFPGYDLIAANADKARTARVQVKSRYRTDWDGFIINNYDCDFVVFAALNRGFSRPKRTGDTGIKEPEFYVMPISYVTEVRDPNNAWGKIIRKRLAGIEQFRDRWDMIAKFLDEPIDTLTLRSNETSQKRTTP
ncbi:hypothetical protein GALL_527410 [mine drainage metagenome]|uniref:Uncharacterized protein n=1 Tax=mine drainage metagenome TaxID=410659 RepID=A0A1J5PK77_9ZZZZ